ncbi:DUF4112 domain-containing protein [Pseudoroseicyclus tamaricis]|uniref:DUF4112 domain-containing protein n=1 Tax=Pseudoroseicyclus tamaricis TaxID=2705421 RepID=UPI001F4661C7|nr:DUF4112 domain-containing protein [Pseudoroseicyclus tamaricis]
MGQPRAGDRQLDHAAELARVERMAKLLDARWRVFGFRVGLDSVMGLVPGIGDTLALAPGVWMIWQARRLGVSNEGIARMLANSGLDYLIGLIPLIGDLFDVGFKANLRNAEILRDHLKKDAERAGRPISG